MKKIDKGAVHFNESLGAASIIGDSLEIHRVWLATRNWAAVPVEKWHAPDTCEPLHLIENQIEWLVTAASKTGCTDCIAIPVGLHTDVGPCYQVEMTGSDLMNFSRICANSDYALIPQGQEFAVVCATEGYNVVAGPHDFVATAIGSTLSTAREIFQMYAEYSEPEGRRARLTGVGRYYSSFNGRAFFVVHDKIKADHLRGFSAGMLSTPLAFSRDWLAEKNWAAVPVGKGYLPDQGAEWLSLALQALDCGTLYAIALNSSAECYGVPSTLEGLRSFHRECNFLDVLLVPEDASCAVLNLNEYCNIVAGPRDFVVKAMGSSLETARNVFINREVIQEWEDGQEYMLEIARYYEEFNGE